MSGANSTDLSQSELQGGSLAVKINRPGKKSTLNVAMYVVLAKRDTKMVF